MNDFITNLLLKTMENNLQNQGIVPTVLPSWPDFAAGTTANGTYMLISNYAVTGTLALNANITIIFAGGRFTGSGTIQGNNTTFVAPPIQVFDSTINFSGTWKMDTVYAENFGDTNTSNSAPAINKALVLSNLCGCIVQLLSKTYTITESIIIRGNTRLQGTIEGPGLTGDSVPSKNGTLITTTSNINILHIQSTGNSSASNIDCYRFAIKNIAIRHSGSNENSTTTGNSIYIESTASNREIIPRIGHISNLIIKHTTSDGQGITPYGYGIYVTGGSYIEFHNINIGYGKGVYITGNKLQEFLWFNKVVISDIKPPTSKSAELASAFEITHGNNIYLTEVDTNDSDVGLMINNSTGETFNVFVNRINSVRCKYGIYLKTFSYYLTRIKISEATISQTSSQDLSAVSALYFVKNATSSPHIDNCIFDNINVDSSNLWNTGFRSIIDNNSIYNSKFLNIKTIDKIALATATANNKLTVLNMQEGGVLRPGSSGSSFSHDFYSNNTNSPNSPMPGKPVVVISTNKQTPFSVITGNIQGGGVTLL